MFLVEITVKMPPKRPQMAQFQNAPKQFLEIALKRAGAGQSYKTNSDFLFFQICQSAYAPLRGRAVKTNDANNQQVQIEEDPDNQVKARNCPCPNR
jgi:hypothetical protein